MLRLPVKTDEAGYQKLSPVFGGFCKGLVQQEGVPHWTIDHAIEDVCEGFALVDENCQLRKSEDRLGVELE